MRARLEAFQAVLGPIVGRVPPPQDAGHGWNEESFFSALKSLNPTGVAAARELLAWATTAGFRATWGRGRRFGSVTPRVVYNGQPYEPFSVWTSSLIILRFVDLRKCPPWDKKNYRLDVLSHHVVDRVRALPIGLWLSKTRTEGEPSRIVTRLNPHGRLLLCRRVEIEGWKVREAAAAAGVSRQTAGKWLARWRSEGASGLMDRTSRPLRIAQRVVGELWRRVVLLRLTKRRCVVGREGFEPSTLGLRVVKVRPIGSCVMSSLRRSEASGDRSGLRTSCRILPCHGRCVVKCVSKSGGQKGVRATSIGVTF